MAAFDHVRRGGSSRDNLAKSMLELICKQTWGTCRKAVALLERRRIPYRYREYTREPLSAKEIERLLDKLGVEPRALLRRRDRAYKELGLTGDEDPKVLIGHLARHPTLLERPIGVLRGRAVVGRPPERLLELFER